MTRANIKLTVKDNGLEQNIETCVGEYQNLMELLKDKIYLGFFGKCGGMHFQLKTKIPYY